MFAIFCHRLDNIYVKSNCDGVCSKFTQDLTIHQVKSKFISFGMNIMEMLIS